MKKNKKLLPPSSLINVSSLIGSNHLLSQGAGGNTSIKKKRSMWIKASGKWLSNAKKEDIFVNLNLTQLNKNLSENKKNPTDNTVLNSNLKPSIETSLHALMPHTVVLHCHAIDVLALLIQKNPIRKISNLLKDINWTLISYVRPGLDLTKAVKLKTSKRKFEVILLQNHGIFVGAKNATEALKLMITVIKKCEAIPRNINEFNIKRIKKVANKISMKLPNFSIIQALAFDKLAFNYCARKNSILYPDQAVFLGPNIIFFNNINDFKKVKKNNFKYVIIKNLGVFVSKKTDKNIDEMLRCHIEILLRVNLKTKLNFLNKNEVNKLINWDAEKYRQSMIK